MSRKLIIVDCDGVVADIYGPALSFIRDRFKDDEVYSQFNWSMVHNWEMSSIRKDVASYFLDLVSNPDYIANLIPYEGAIPALQLLQDIAREYNFQVFMSTAVFNTAVGKARECWIQNIQRHLKDELFYHIQESSRVKAGKDKPVFDAVSVIEDNLEVLRAYNVLYPYVIDHHHNREINNPGFIDVFNRTIRVSSLMVAAKDLESCLKVDK